MVMAGNNSELNFGEAKDAIEKTVANNKEDIESHVAGMFQGSHPVSEVKLKN
jgi:hypothetical protein